MSSILDFPIADNMGPVLDLLAENPRASVEEFLDEGPSYLDSEAMDAMPCSSDEYEQAGFAWGYLRGLGDAWDMTALQVWEEHQHAVEQRDK